MDIEIAFPGNLRVDANFGGVMVQTDQPVSSGGDGGAPSPFQLFLASIGTCAGIYVLYFLKERNLPTQDVKLVQRLEHDPKSGMISRIAIDIVIPATIPEKYHKALIKSANLCAVKKHLMAPPEFEIRTVVV